MRDCGCTCVCHHDPDWPGPCEGCCNPGDDCKCGQYLAGYERGVIMQRDRDAAVALAYADELKNTSHIDGLGMGWLAGEDVCRDISDRIRNNW